MEMTNREKIIQLENTIYQLYVKEGRSKKYISELLEVNRKYLTEFIKDKKWIQGDRIYISPSNQKFINQHRTFIKSQLDTNHTISSIADSLGVDRHYLRRVSKLDKVLSNAFEEYHNRIHLNARKREEKLKEESKFEYYKEDLSNEEWKQILGYEYEVSNMGRIRKYIKRYDDYMIIQPFKNSRTNRYYVKLDDKNLQLARIVAHGFCVGYSKENNTVNHIDGNLDNNKAENLEWVSQAVNNKKAYDDLGRQISKPYSKYGNFKKIVLDNKYEFSSIRALAKFLGVSETQTRRYIDKETKTEHIFEFKY